MNHYKVKIQVENQKFQYTTIIEAENEDTAKNNAISKTQNMFGSQCTLISIVEIQEAQVI